MKRVMKRLYTYASFESLLRETEIPRSILRIYVHVEETLPRRDHGNCYRYRERALLGGHIANPGEIPLTGYIIRILRDSAATTEISEVEVRDAERENGNWEQMLASSNGSVILSFNCSSDLYNFHVHCHLEPRPGL